MRSSSIIIIFRSFWIRQFSDLVARRSKSFLVVCCLVIIGTSAILGQTPTPTPPPNNDEPVVRISTNLIQIDVTVTDKNGNLVTDLTPEDFELFENGEKQSISNFTLVKRSVGNVQFGTGAAPGSGNTAIPIPIKSSEVRRTLAIVVDDLNMSFSGIYYTRKALNKFVDEQMQPDDLVAVIRTGGSVGALQQFTSDKRVLHAAIEKIRWNPLAGTFDSLSSVGQNANDISDRFAREAELASSEKPKTSTLIRPRDIDPSREKNDAKAAAYASSDQRAFYAQTSLGAVKYIISGMTKLPGRKVMMLFSDGVGVGTDPSKSKISSAFSYLQDVADFANRSTVVVYTFDTKGMRSMSIGASDSTYEIIDGHRGLKEQERTRDFRDSQDGLAYFANQTGGKALLNSDNFNGGLQRALDEQASYYLLGYVPDVDTFDPNKRKFNKLEVKVKRPGLRVSYRSGFFSNNPDSGQKPALTVERQIAEALMSPFTQSDVTVNINALYAHDPAEGSYVRSFLHIDAKDLTFTETPDGWKTANFDVVAMMFGDNGAPVKDIESKYTIKAKGATYESTLKNGFVYVLIMPIKNPGLYQYRVAVRDSSSGKIGSASQVIEAPNLDKQKLVISSLAVEDLPFSTWQNITQGKVGNKPGQIQVQSTLLYDTVLKKFPAGTVLRYGYEVYNAKADGASPPDIETEAKILQNDRVVIAGKPVKFDASTQPDRTHLRISSAIMLNDALQPGDYVLQIVVTDKKSKQISNQLFPFEIVK